MKNEGNPPDPKKKKHTKPSKHQEELKTNLSFDQVLTLAAAGVGAKKKKSAK
jgi:hypothetical protein